MHADNSLDLQKKGCPKAHLISKTPKVVIIHNGALGDFLLALPALEGLYCSYPNIRMHSYARPELVSIIAHRPYVSSVQDAGDSGLAPFFHDSMWKKAAIPFPHQGTDAIFIFGQTGSRVLCDRFSERLNIPSYWIQSFPSVGCIRPVSEFILEQLRCYGWNVDGGVARLKASEADDIKVKCLLQKMGLPECSRPVVIHPGSGGRKKVWPLARWWSFLRWMRHHYPLPIVMTLGPADELLEEFALQASSRLGIHILREISLSHLSALLAQAKLYVGSDSGVSHLAAVMGAASIVLFGPTLAEVWAPQGPNVHIVKSNWNESEILSYNVHASEMNAEAPLLCAVREALNPGNTVNGR